MWIASACRERGQKVVTVEIDPDKADLARQTFHAAGVERCGGVWSSDDGVDQIGQFGRIAFLFLDADKEVYLPVTRKPFQ